MPRSAATSVVLAKKGSRSVRLRLNATLATFHMRGVKVCVQLRVAPIPKPSVLSRNPKM